MLKLQASFKGEIKNLNLNFRVVIIQGTVAHQISGDKIVNLLEAGTYFGAAENSTHNKSVKEDQEAYVL
ncbi:DUF4437 domain-containing protein [Winogradskyella psychrotolerans]|uniref:DUF4437 domain-containing protein n=1 Tax=Winogradskyella psychrotolerans TaxID=1344585 RepID=UPI001C07C193|nr:DUF4437 domain-containing protein [Winogradskyella psychrotolerans]MBU2929298.1 DUF4437 domain-containing protein [Winogradskyella psychrotolerans]